MKLPDCVNPFHKDNKRKEILFGAFLVLSFFIFHTYFENSFNEAFLEEGEGEKTPVMLRLIECIKQNSILGIVAFGLAILAMFVNVCAYWKRRIISGEYLWALSFIAGFYLFYRFKIFDVWDFEPIYAPFLVYTDLILFFTLSEFITASWFWIKKYSQEPFFEKSWVGKIRRPQWFRSCIFLILQKLNEKLFKEEPLAFQNNGFVADSPLDEENNEDKFGYEDYAENVAQRIIGTPKFKHSFAIGINGKWGSGKSSFMYLVEEKLKKELGEDIIEVKFNPWRSESSAAIIKDFFEEFQQALRPYSSRTGSLLQEYSDKLVDADKTDVLKLLKLGKELIWHGQSKESLFEEIKDILEKIDCKIFVYIDDLDRLDNNEIVEVLKLVRNTANFPNTFFVVAYDRDYVISAIDKINSHNKEFFLEKIFSLEINLPLMDKQKLIKMLEEKLTQAVGEKETKKIISNFTLHDWLESGRDIIRIVNSYQLNRQNILGSYIPHELFLLEFIRIKHPLIYACISKGKNSEILSLDYSTGRYSLNMFSFPIQGNNLLENQNEGEDKHEKSLNQLESINNGNLDKVRASLILRTIEFIFENKQKYDSISYVDSFYRYFFYGKKVIDFTQEDFDNLFKRGQDEINITLLEWQRSSEDKKIASFFSFHKFKRDNFFKLINSIFYINGNKESNRGLDYHILHKELIDLTANVYFISGKNKTKKVKKYILRLLNQKSNKNLYNLYVIEKDVYEGKIISTKEYYKLLSRLFEHELKKSLFSERLIQMLNCSTVFFNPKNNTLHSNGCPIMIEKLINFIQDRDLEGYLRHLYRGLVHILTHPPYELKLEDTEKDYFENTRDEIVAQLRESGCEFHYTFYRKNSMYPFQDFPEFEAFLNSQDRSKYPFIVEFEKLYNVYKSVILK